MAELERKILTALTKSCGGYACHRRVNNRSSYRWVWAKVQKSQHFLKSQLFDRTTLHFTNFKIILTYAFCYTFWFTNFTHDILLEVSINENIFFTPFDSLALFVPFFLHFWTVSARINYAFNLRICKTYKSWLGLCKLE